MIRLGVKFVWEKCHGGNDNQGTVEVKKADRPAPAPVEWRPFESLRRDRSPVRGFPRRVESPFGRTSFDVEPFWRSEMSWGKTPAVDVVEKDKAYEITAELPGMDESNIEVKFSDGILTITGEKSEEKEERRRTTICPSVGTARSSVRSPCRPVSIPTRSRRTSRTACSRSLAEDGGGQKSEKKIEIKKAT